MNIPNPTSPTVEVINETKKCPDCLADIPKAAKKCSHCGKKQKMPVTKFQIGVIAVLLFVVVVPALMGGSSNRAVSTEQVDSKPTGQEAFIISQNYILKALKSPKTAEFPSGEYNFNLVGDKTYVVTSYVDSQNGFGALIRSSYTASMTFNGGDWSDSNNWTLETLVMDGKDVYVRKAN